MRKSIETLKNIWKIEDLRQRILITILFVAIYRFGSYVVLPGINPVSYTHLRAIKMAIANTMRMGAEGIKIQISGRLNGAETVSYTHLDVYKRQTLVNASA